MKSDDNNIHLVVLTPGFPANEDDKNCIPPLQAYMKTLATVGKEYKVTIISLHYPFARKEYCWHGITVKSLGAANCAYPKRIMYWYAYFWQLVQLHKNSPIHLIHAFWLHECSFIGSWFAYFFNIPFTATVMGQDAVKPNRFIPIIRFKNNILTTLSIFQTQQLHQSFRISAHNTIPWGIDIAEPQKYIHPCRDIDILGVGSHIPLKNYTLFLHIINKIKINFPHIKVYLVGDGVQNAELQTLAELLGLHETIVFTGHIPREQVLALMGRSKIFLHTSLYESQGYVLWEALYLGCYVVSSKIGTVINHPKWLITAQEADYCEIISKILLSDALKFDNEKVTSIENTFLEYDMIYKKLTNRLHINTLKKKL